MKNSTFLKLFFFLGLLVQNPQKLHSQYIVSIKTIPEPPTVGAPFQLEVWSFFTEGAPGACYDLLGYVLDSNSTTLEITIYYDTWGIRALQGCYGRDTLPNANTL